jgi:sialic acid synthase
LKKGDVIGIDDLHMLSPGDGFKWSDVDKVVGRTVVNDIPANEIIYPKDIK